MNDEELLGVPFINRKMLAFEKGIVFKLKLQVQSDNTRKITIRGMTKEGVFSFKHTCLGTTQVETEYFGIPDVPIFVSVLDDQSLGVQGEITVTLSLVANDDIITELCSGLIYQTKNVSYPQQIQKDLVPNGGKICEIDSTDPAAGAQATITVPVGEIWRILNGNIQFVTAAAVANRRLQIIFSDGAGPAIYTFSNTDQIISETKGYSIAPYGVIQAETNGNIILINIPKDIWIRGGGTISTAVTNMNAGDNLGVLTLLIEKFYISN
jgi:hypothetical protein